jgi:hypothetical protein
VTATLANCLKYRFFTPVDRQVAGTSQLAALRNVQAGHMTQAQPFGQNSGKYVIGKIKQIDVCHK